MRELENRPSGVARTGELPVGRSCEPMFGQRSLIGELRKDDGYAAADCGVGLERRPRAEEETFSALSRNPRGHMRAVEIHLGAGSVGRVEENFRQAGLTGCWAHAEMCESETSKARSL